MAKPVLLIRGDGNEKDEQALAKLGIESLIDPYIEIAVAKDSVSGVDLLSAMENAAAPLWLIATSLNAFRFWAQIVGEERLRKSIAARVDLQFAAVGQSTAEILRSFGAHDVFTPTQATGKSLADELAAKYPRGHVLIPGGNLAMKNLPSLLVAAGWQVGTAVVYTTSPVAKEPNSARLVREKEVSAILFRSPSAVRALARFLPHPDVPLVCAGVTTAEALQSQGLRADAVSSEPSAEVVASTIHSLLCKERI